MKRSLAIAGILAGLALVGYGLVAGETDEEKIRAVLERLEASVETCNQGGNFAVRALRLKGEFSELFEPDVRARIPELGSTHEDREELAALAARSGAYFQDLDLELEQVHVRVDDSERNARVTCVVVLTATRRGQREPRRDQRSVTFNFFNHEEHGWRIASIRAEPREAYSPEG
jgi:hypothetical protein